MYLRLVKHLDDYNLFCPEQHGFRQDKSVNTALISFTESLIEAMDGKSIVAGVFMDLSKAFDSISHIKIIKKLNNIGVKNSFLNWFSSYLTNRSQYVEISKTEGNQIIKYQSNSRAIKHGVPQGSILGPLLFICYIKDMPNYLTKLNHIKNQLILYADDSNLIMSAKTDIELEISSFIELGKIQDFFTTNNLILNPQKTNYMHFTTKQNRMNNNFKIFIDDNVIGQVDHTKFLGVYIDNHLSWDLHIEHILSKINSGIYALRRLYYLCNLTVLKNVFHAHVQSHISYGICVYGGTSKQNLNKVLIIQKRALRDMLNLKPDESVKQHFIDQNILTVHCLYIRECVMHVRKNIDNYVTHQDIHCYNTRNKNNLVLPRHNSELFKKKASYAGSVFLKHIPKDLLRIENNNKFKNALKSYLIDKVFYSLEEFYNLNILNQNC